MLKTHSYRIPGLMIRDHVLACPLRPTGTDTIPVFAREIIDIESIDTDQPMLVYLQGGPGFESPRPQTHSGWIREMTKRYRVLLLDQRGTGRSSAICNETLMRLGSSATQAEYLGHFRADAIVRDAEQYRETLLGKDTQWTILGQSFGGFCAVHYLSAAPQGLAGALITGGLPPLSGGPDPVYRALYKRVRKRNERYFRRFPMDRDRFNEILDFLGTHTVHLPSSTRLTPDIFKQIGMALGASDGFEAIHYLLENAFVEGPDGRVLSYRFLHAVDCRLPFNTNPIYALLHESIYCQGESSRWSAHRIRSEFDEFTATHAADPLMTGEMVYPWMFEHYGQLTALKPVAEALAQRDDWPELYNLDALAQNKVPCAAAVYYDDMYVERMFSEETADAIGGMRVWVTNEYDHNGLRVDGARIVKRLHHLMDDVQ